MELVVAGVIFAFGALVIYDSMRLGNKWGDDGPQAGYFPFYVGLILCIASGVTFVRSALSRLHAGEVFVTLSQLKLVMAVLVPTIVYVWLIGPAGMYVASIVFMAWFMRVLGKYSWVKVVAIPVVLNVVFFAVFEFWFKVPLPKGPLEAALGLN
jgi:putative tricarboxylic transport membrane protein